jgi:hypothetical protein
MAVGSGEAVDLVSWVGCVNMSRGVARVSQWSETESAAQ